MMSEIIVRMSSGGTCMRRYIYAISQGSNINLPYIPVYNAMFFLSHSCHKKAGRIIHRGRTQYNFLAL